MNLGGDTKQQFAGCRLLGMNSLFLTLSEVVCNGMLKLRPQFRHGFPVKANNAADAENAANEDIVSLVVLDTGGMALV